MMPKLTALGIAVILAGFALVFAGSSTGGVSGGGVIFIGPFPIVFGGGPGGLQLALAALAVGAAMMVLFFFWFGAARAPKQG